MFCSGLSRIRRLPSSRPCTRPWTIFGCSCAKPRWTISTSAMISRLRLEVRTWACPPLPLTTSETFGSHVTHAGELVLARLHVAQEQVAGLEAVLGIDHVQAIGVRRRVEAAERIDRQPGLLCEVADEEVDLGELRRRDRLALQLVDALDVAAHHDAVGAAREADLRRHHRVQLAPVGRQHVDRGHRRGDLAFVQLGPGLVLADRQLDLEPVVLEEQRVLGRLETAVGGDEAGVAGVFADLDRDDVVLELERARRRQLRNFDLHLLHFGRAAALRRGLGAWRRSARAPRAAEAAADHVEAERDQSGDQQDRDDFSQCGEARLLVHCSGPISFAADGVDCAGAGED